MRGWEGFLLATCRERTAYDEVATEKSPSIEAVID
jgi:hypothetical protein